MSRAKIFCLLSCSDQQVLPVQVCVSLDWGSEDQCMSPALAAIEGHGHKDGENPQFLYSRMCAACKLCYAM